MSFCTTSVLRCNTKDTAACLADDEFMALEEEVTIIPRVTTDEEIDCINAQIGPFKAHNVCRVPFWAAMAMDKLQLCHIEPPSWLNEAGLKQMKEAEKGSQQLTKVPYHYMEIAFAFLQKAQSFQVSGAQREQLKLLLREVIEARRAKITAGMRSFDALQPAEYDVTNFSAAELSCFRTRTFHALDSFLDLLKTSRRVGDRTGDELGGGAEGDDTMSMSMEDSSAFKNDTDSGFGPTDSFGPTS